MEVQRWLGQHDACNKHMQTCVWLWHPNKISTMASGVCNPVLESQRWWDPQALVQLAKPNQFAPDLVRDLSPEVADG